MADHPARWHRGTYEVERMSSRESAREGSGGEYSLDDEDQLQPEDTLVDRGVEDVLDEGYSPPDRPVGLDAEQRAGGSLERRLAAEEPDSALAEENPPESDETDFPEDREVGGRRAGRLLAPDEGGGEDREQDLLAQDVGIDGGAASAEEAAVHIVDEEDVDEEDEE